MRTRELRNKGKGVVHYNVKECIVHRDVECDREEFRVSKI